MATRTLLSLPEELIDHICWKLVGHPHSRSIDTLYDPKSLSSLCRVSKSLNRIAMPVLYARFDAMERMKRTADFLRTISLRPELGGYVQEATFSMFNWFPLTEDHLKVFTEAATRLGVSLDDWMENYPFEAVVQLIIAQTPNVRTIDVAAHEVYADDGAGAFTILEQIAAQVPPRISLPHLERLSVGHDDCRRISLGYFGGIIELAPYIREITMSPCYGLQCDEKHVNNRLTLKNVTNLQLDGGHISKLELESIVRLCGGLENFDYGYHSIYAGLSHACVTPREVIEILMPHNNTLRSISINLGWREREHPTSFSFSGLCTDGDQIISLKNFSRLETFRVDGTSLLFPEVQKPGYHTNILINLLPTSIRCFHLANAQRESVANLITLTDSIADFPFLKEISLTGNSVNGPLGEEEVVLDESEMSTLRKILSDKGIKFEEMSVWE
ncbi:hypothetical protein TARUN_2847 [Trichoderma arundinaceum]|uniref:F-box domain-containing protein n=1 Tax=Trichoderma arundinaceum TaxID=490622 RepID=A0A395NTJ0_TRIAR|nr:hypothetical protein TARUN_2847 [Trichoderma arundinaceum]